MIPAPAAPQTATDRRYRLAIVALHVVQYHAPLYRLLAASDRLDVEVFYLDRTGAVATWDATMATHIDWDVPLLDGYSHTFVRNFSPARRGPAVTSRINPGLPQHLRRVHWDAVLVQGYQPFSFWLAFQTARTHGIPTIFRGESCLRPPLTGLKERMKQLVWRTVFRFSDVVLFSCRGNRRFFEHYGCPPEKLWPMPCAIDNDFFRSARAAQAEPAAQLRRHLEIPPEMPIVLNVGRQDERKRPLDLLAAVDRLQKAGREVALVLVGDGPLASELQRQSQERGLRHVHFAGFVNQSEIPRYYELADIFALCSTYDPSPKALNEVLNFELPVVCTRAVGTVGDIAVDGENARIYDAGDVDALAAALDDLVMDPELRQRMGQRSYELADDYSLDSNVRSLEELLPRLATREEAG